MVSIQNAKFCLPDHVDLDNCKDMGISREPVEEYLKSKE